LNSPFIGLLMELRLKLVTAFVQRMILVMWLLIFFIPILKILVLICVKQPTWLAKPLILAPSKLAVSVYSITLLFAVCYYSGYSFML